MALPLKQILKSPLLNYLFLGLIGAISTLAFSPFDIKPIIFITLSVLIYSVISAKDFTQALKRSLSWGVGYWIAGTGWLIVSIYYYGNTSISISILIIALMGVLLSTVFIGPISFIKLLNLNHNILFKSLAITSLLTLLELSRFIFLGGFPWLLPGLVFIDTFVKFVIPIVGVYGASFLAYFLCSFIALSAFYKKRLLFMTSLFCLLLFLPYQNTQQEVTNESLNLSIIQPSLNPFTKFEQGAEIIIEDRLINLTKNNLEADLIIWPEAPLPYLNTSLQMTALLKKLDNSPYILSGAWEYKENGLNNIMTILGTNQTYSKRHLVPFGEYVPFEGILRGLIEFFDLPMSSVQEGSPNQGFFMINDLKVLGMICFDIAFPLSYINEVRDADFIINISNDTWFGNSYGPYQHLQIVRLRALEANKWIGRGTSDGISTIVDNKGTIVSILSKGNSGSLEGKIYKTNESTFFYSFGYIIIPLISMFVMMLVIILRLKQ